MLGILFAALSSLCFGTAAVLARLGLRHISPSLGTFVSVAASLVVVAILTLGREAAGLLSVSLAALLWFGLIGFLNFFVGRQANYTATKYIGVARANPMLSAGPLFAMLVAVIFAGETVNAYIVTGTLLIVVGVVSLVKS